MRREYDLLNNNHTPVGIYPQPNFNAVPARLWPAQWHPSEDFPTPQSGEDDAFSHVVSDGLLYDQASALYRLGDESLPVAPFREHFVDIVRHNQAVVASSETGSGKSSQFGLYLLEAGFPRVFVSSPRILAARQLKERAQQSLGPDLAHLAGYLTGNASDSDCSSEAKLIYVTEQLLYKIANRGKLRPNDVVINDEAHERTLATEFLQGLMKELLFDNPDMRLIVSSASIDTAKFSHHLADQRTGEPAQVLILPGRTYEITRRETNKKVAEAAREYMQHGHNVLAFEPGVSRMKATSARMSSRNRLDTVHLLYGDQSPREQKEALNSEDHNHMVANRIGETSITPQGKDVVIDSGLSNVGRYEQGVRVLATIFSSKDTLLQRSGRVGRTSPGTYVLAQPEDAPVPPSFEERADYEVPAIQNSSVTSYIAELLSSGRRLENLDLLDGPTHENLQHDYRLLRRLGAIAIEQGTDVLTDVGRAMIDLPLDMPLARMLVEARSIPETSQLSSNALRLQVAALAAIQQVNGILNGCQNSKRRYLLSRRHEDNLSNEHLSDVLFELDTFTSLLAKQQKITERTDNPDDAELRFDKLLEERDILPNRYYKALRTFEEVCRREGLNSEELQKATAAERQAIITCQISGAEELFVQKSKMVHWDIRGETRRLGRRSTIAPQLAKLVIGTAFDLRGLRENGRFERRFISGASVVTTEQLLQHAQERITRKSLGYGVTKEGSIIERQALYFDGEIQFDEVEAAPSPTLASREFIIKAMMSGVASAVSNPNFEIPYNPGTPNATLAIRQFQKAKELDQRSRANLRVKDRHDKLISKIARDSALTIPLNITDPAILDQIIPPVYMNALVKPTQKKNIPTILKTSPDGLLLHYDDDNKEWVDITYRQGIAYVTVPRNLRFKLNRQDFTELAANHGIKLRIANGKYSQIDAVFRQIEEQRASPKREKRLQHRAEIAAAAESPAANLQAIQIKSRSDRRKFNEDLSRLHNAPLARKLRRRIIVNRESRTREFKESSN